MDNNHDKVAARLIAAYKEGPIEPLRDDLPPEDADGAYSVQRAATRQWLESGRTISGRKIGLTAKVVQQALGVDQPDYGTLFTDMEIPDGGVLSPQKTLQPRTEAEVALVLKQGLPSSETTKEDVAAATDYAVAAIEIVDSRIADWRITFADTVADNGSSAFYVLGTERRSLDGLDLYSCGMVMTVNDEIVSLGAGAACLGHPLEAAAWLARALAARDAPLQAGEVILTGALGPMVDLKPGDHVEAVIGGMGRCGFYFGDD